VVSEADLPSAEYLRNGSQVSSASRSSTASYNAR
jgi:hypothetical protein